MSAIWSETPPTEPGWYWVRYRGSLEELAAYFDGSDRSAWRVLFDVLSAKNGRRLLEFGPRIESAAAIAARQDLVRAVDRFLSMHAPRSKAENEDRLAIRKLIDQVKGDGAA